MKVSRFGEKIRKRSGISQLMVDLGEWLLGGDETLMLGGGNPAHIPEVEKVFRGRMLELLNRPGEFERVVGDYDPAQGNAKFIDAMCGLLRKECGWEVSAENIALTNGSQLAFFMLFNLFGGLYPDGKRRKILFPLAPEYIGYADMGIEDNLFVARRPDIELRGEHGFKYHVAFERLTVADEVGAICVSRPTNPSTNVLTDEEIEKLSTTARQREIPLIIDSAYGAPFPNIVFAEARPFWKEGVIVCMSLSKLGLPATRTGIVVADREVISMLAEMNAVISLAIGSIGAAIGAKLVESGELLRLSREVIPPFYKQKAEAAAAQLRGELAGVDFRIHEPEGAFFLWLWMPGLQISDMELYERLKKRGVVVVPGRYFFPGLEESWPHKQQCIRVSYAQDAAVVSKGLHIIAEEIRRACKARQEKT